MVIAWDVRSDSPALQHTLALAVAETLRLRRYTTVASDLWWLTPQVSSSNALARSSSALARFSSALARFSSPLARSSSALVDLWWLTPQSLEHTVWAGWQHHLPAERAGCAVFFRRDQAAAPSMAAGLRGVTSGACFRVVLYDNDYMLASNTTMGGADLAKLEVRLPLKMSSALLEYALAPPSSCKKHS